MSRGFESHTLRIKKARSRTPYPERPRVSQTTKPAKRGRRPVARHGALKSPHPFSQFMKLVGVVVAVVLVAGAGVAAYAAYDLTSSYASGAVALEGQTAVPPDIGAIEGGVNLFIAGTDECRPEFAQFFGNRCKGPDASGELNDVNLLVHISDKPRRVTVISFPRDLMVPIPSCTAPDGSQTSAMSDAQINSSYGYGGLSCVVKTVSSLSGLNIPFAAKVNFGGVINITDAIGGVDICIGNGGIRDVYTGIDWPAGMRTVTGIDALEFLRTRHGLVNGSDLARISNQQQYMSRLARKLVSENVLSNPATLLKLASTAVQNVTPSQSLTNPITLVQIALAVKSVPFDQIVFVQYPVFDDPSNPNRVVPDYKSAKALWAALAANQPISLTSNPNNSGGVVVQSPAPTTAPAPAPTATAGATPAPSQTAVALPSNIPGVDANQQTCSAGNVSG